MNPRKAKELLPELAQEMNLPLELLEDLHDFYWKDVRRMVTSLEYPHIRVNNLGSWHSRRSEILIPYIKTMEMSISKYKDNPPKTNYLFAKYDTVRRNIIKCKRLLANYFEEQKAQDQNKILRKQIREAKEAMEKPQADPGGII